MDGYDNTLRKVLLPALMLALLALPRVVFAASLFSPAQPDGVALASVLEAGNVERVRYVTMNLSLLRDVQTMEEADAPKEPVVFNFFEGLEVPVNHLRTEYHGASRVWVGRIVGQPESMVTIGVTEGVAMGTMRTEEGHLIEIRFAGGDVYAVRQMDMGGFASCQEPLLPGEGALPPRDASETPGVAGDDGSTIDVMVVYTESAVTAVGGTTAMQSLVATAISETNQGYSNSGVTQRINLVHQAQVSYDESSGFSAALDAVTTNGDGQMDEVHTWRDTYNADMVSLWINNSQYCGLAWLMTSTSTDFSAYAFSVVAYNCATGYYSFAHEMGHNQGCAHERENASSAVFDYSYGYKHASSPLFRTIMSYACTGVTCPRVNYWSNPNVSYNGEPMGIDVGSSQAAYNALSLNNTNTIAANWRDSGGGGSTATVGEVFRNYSNGQTGVMKVSSSTNPEVTMFPTVSSLEWTMVGAGDFNGDGQSDVAWRNTATGQNGFWLFSSGTPVATYIQSVPDQSWEIQATGDMNGDGKTDLLWRNVSTGSNLVWLMDGATHTEVSLPAESDTTWSMGTAGDFNSDGSEDIVWRNYSSGEVKVVYMSNYTQIGLTPMPTVASASWRIFGSGDYNNDGMPDIFWYNTDTGVNGLWQLDTNLNSTNVQINAISDTNWRAEGAAGDF